MNGSRTSHWPKRGIAVDSVDLNFRMNATGNAVPELRKAQGAVQRLGTQIDKSNARMRGFNNGITTMQANTRKFAMGGLQQAGYQLGDYAVQVANGTSKMQAFGQQAPQFLQIFGPFGAILGAGVAILSAFAVAMDRTRNASKEAKEEVVTFGQSVAQLQKIDTASATENLSAPARAAMSEYSALLGMMQKVAEEQRVAALATFAEDVAPAAEIAKLEKQLEVARNNASMLSDAVLAANENIGKAAKANEDRILGQIKDQKDVRDIILSIQGKTRLEAAKNLSAAIDTLRAQGLMTDELESQLSAFAESNGLVEATAKLSKELKEETADAADETERAASAAAKLKAFMAQATARAVAFSKAISAAPSNLQAMKDQTATTLAQVAAIKSGYSEAAASAIAYRKQRELELGLADAGSEAENAYLSALINKDVEAFEARAKANAQLAEAMTKFDDLGTKGAGSLAKTTESVSKVAKAIKTELTPEMQRLKGIQDSVASSFENAMMSAVDGTKSVKDAFKSMAVEIIKELYRVFVVKQITGFISSAIGGYFNTNQVSGASMPLGTGSVRPQARPLSFAGGGYTGNGARAGGLDGKGGRMAMIHPRETVIDHAKGQGMGGVTVIQNNTFGSGVSRAEVNAMLPKMIEATKAAVVDAKRQGGSYGRAFA